ncbi:MAG: NAD-dependent epimerase/dehydratase family protein [Bdellovibrionales bacterium]|nr:NAD-dependent epimerase/dehydratase family protein [Bdellovibrionales bacterium]
MNKKTWAITGSSGYLGSALSDHLENRGHRVKRLTRHQVALTDAKLSSLHFQGADILVHAAHDFRPRKLPDLLRINCDGSKRIFQAAKAAGVSRILFISSVSAFEGCESIYGRCKLMTEKIAAQASAQVIRPGLIFGGKDGSAYGRVKKLMSLRIPILPLIDQGRAKIDLVHLDFLLTRIEDLGLSEPVQSNPIYATTETLSFLELLQRLEKKTFFKTVWINFPYSAGIGFLRFFERLGIRLPFWSDQLVSLLKTNPIHDK